MSTVEHPEPRVVPPLIAGERMDQPTFHERYQGMRTGTWAELVGGVVYMPSPLRADHGGIDHFATLWLMHYRRFTPGLDSGANVSTKLGPLGEVQPDAQLRIPEDHGGRSRLVAGYVVGPPELVVEIARASRSFDLGAKKNDYERAGVLEYLFVGIEPEDIRWFASREGKFVSILADNEGVLRSEAFPGLWLDPGTLLAGDFEGIIAALERGLASPEHAAFVADLAARKDRR